MNRVVSRLGLTAIAIVAGSVAGYAQSSTTGSVNGVVTDDKGAPLAGATVTFTSAQVTRTATTGSDGSYRLGLLNPGSWSVRVSKDGFQTVSQKVDVATNENRSFSPRLSPVGSTTVVITTTVPVVDLTSTTQGQNVSMESVAAVPKGRDFTTMAFFAPGVVSSGFGDPSISGASGAENSYVVDGLTTTDFRFGFQGASLKTDFIDQVEVQTGGFRPEFSALGGVFNAVTKSGSNDFKGSAWLTWDAIGIQAVSKRGDFGFRQAAPNSRYDLGLEVGGAFIKDKLFYFFGVDGDLSESPSATPNGIGLVGSKAKSTDIQTLGKINWYLTQDMQLTFFLNYNDVKTTQDITLPNVGTANSGGEARQKTLNFTTNFDWTISPSLLLSLKLGTTNDKQTFDPTDATDIRVTDNNYFNPGFSARPIGGPGGTNTLNPYYHAQPETTPFVHGGAGFYTGLNKGVTNQFKADLSWFLGSHTMKFGVSWLESKYTEINRTSGSLLQGDDPTSYGYAAGYHSGERDSIRISNAGGVAAGYNGDYGFNGLDRQFLSTDATVKADFTAFYAQDQWEVMPGFRLMYGLRYEIQDQKDLHGKSFLKYDKFQDVTQPRVGFTWDVNNDGKDKVSASYATYYEQIPQRVAIRVFANETYLRFRYNRGRVNYSSVDGSYSIKQDPNSQTGALYGPQTVSDFATPFSFDPIALNTKLPQRQEYTLGYDHTFGNGWTAGLHAKHRVLKNPIEDQVITDKYGNPYDEGPAISNGFGSQYGAGAAILGNPGSFQEWAPNPLSLTNYYIANNIPVNTYGVHIVSYYDQNRGVFSVHNTGYDQAGNKYDSVDFTLDKRTDRDYVAFSYTWSRLEGNYEGVVSSSNGQADGNITASFDYYPYVGYGLLPLDRTNVAKLQFSHRFTVAGNDLNIGGAWTYQSGTPVSLFDDGSTTNGYAPGYDTAHVVYTRDTTNVLLSTLSGTTAVLNPVVVNSDAAYADPNNYDPNTGKWIGGIGAGFTHDFLDIGGYGNATPANGKLGQYGRTPATNNVDFHADYVIKIAQKFRVTPTVDLFNAFNTRYTTNVLQQATDQGGNADNRYGAANAWQAGRRWRFGVKFQF